MNSIIKQIFRGELDPGANFRIKDEEYKEIQSALQREYGYFESILREIDPRLEERFIDLKDDVNAPGYFEEEEVFVRGFKLGARLMAEIKESDE